MLKLLLFAGLVVAAALPQTDNLHKIALPPRRTFARSNGEVNGPALLTSLQNTLNKYHANSTVPSSSTNPTLQRRLVTEKLTDQVGGANFDEEYYGPIEVGSGSTQQMFTAQFDTGSADLFIPGPQCTSNEGCPHSTKYNQDGVSQGRTAEVEYGSGMVEGNVYTDTVNVAGLTATGQGLISLTEATGFSTSAADGILGMGFNALSSSNSTTFFENLIAQNKVGT